MGIAINYFFSIPHHLLLSRAKPVAISLLTAIAMRV